MDSKVYLQVVLILVCFSYSTNSQTIESCCSHVSQDEPCHTACMQFASPECSPNVENKTEYLIDYCPQIPPILNACFDNISSNTATQPTPDPQLLNCCMTSLNEGCREVCLEQITKGELGDSAIQTVIAACGPPLIPGYDPVWNCFLLYAGGGNQNQSPPPSNSNTGANMNCSNISITTNTPPTSTPLPTINYADWPRLHCCSKANDSVCLEACLYEFTGSRTTSSWERLNLDCKYRATEGELTSCLDDVTSRCSTKCRDTLEFCSNFNNRPFTSFRNCSAGADAAAKNDYNRWLTFNAISHPAVEFNVKPLSTCYPEWWKLVACSFHLMPCQSYRDTSLICKEDCLFLVNSCKQEISLDAEEICEKLSPSNLQTDCISLQNYLNVSSYTKEVIDNVLTTPCSSNPCTKGKCIINKECTFNNNERVNCQTYHCIDESQIGNAPKMIVKQLNTIHVSTSPFSQEQSCYGYVNCTIDSTNNDNCVFGGKASNVSNVYCIEETSCMHKGTNYSHNEIFNEDCNVCMCKSSRVICTHHICRHDNTTLSSCSPPQCNCPSYYEPVCTSNGLVLPNVHFANCHEYNFDQSCSHDINDPCERESQRCSTNSGVESKCVPHPRVCLSTSSGHTCPQHHCVSSNNCDKYQNKVICDKNGRQHDSMCSFINNQEQVDYYGYCKEECSSVNRRQVCGVNGQTYASSCHAKGVGIAVDYIGPCSGVPNASGLCEGVDKCPGLPYFNNNEKCHGPTPPGSCCPQCGAMLNILIDHQQLERNRKAMNISSIDSTDIIDRLRTYVDILECELYGHQTIDGSFIVLLLPSNMTLTINVEGCHVEAIRLSNLINRGSPLLMSDPYLSFLVAANHTLSWKQFRPPTVTEPSTGGYSGCGTLKASTYFLYTIIVLLITIGWAELLR